LSFAFFILFYFLTVKTGGMLSHAAIVAREFGIPAIVGSKDATTKFKTGDIVTIDTNTHSVTRVQQEE